MSKQGVERMAQVFNEMQIARGDLLKMASEKPRVDTVDLRFAQMLEEAKDTIKDEFAELADPDRTKF